MLIRVTSIPAPGGMETVLLGRVVGWSLLEMGVARLGPVGALGVPRGDVGVAVVEVDAVVEVEADAVVEADVEEEDHEAHA